MPSLIEYFEAQKPKCANCGFTLLVRGIHTNHCTGNYEIDYQCRECGSSGQTNAPIEDTERYRKETNNG